MPRVEDMTGFIEGPCKHPVLFFSYGGFHVICSKCSQMWVAKGHSYAENPELEDQQRVAPDQLESEVHYLAPGDRSPVGICNKRGVHTHGVEQVTCPACIELMAGRVAQALGQ